MAKVFGRLKTFKVTETMIRAITIDAGDTTNLIQLGHTLNRNIFMAWKVILLSNIIRRHEGWWSDPYIKY